MTDRANELYDRINRLESEEIVAKIRSGYFDGGALPIASEILRSRGITVPTVDAGYVEKKEPLYKRRPILFFTLLGVVTLAAKRLFDDYRVQARIDAERKSGK
jgi:hypothetical protein